MLTDFNLHICPYYLLDTVLLVDCLRWYFGCQFIDLDPYR